MRAWIVAGASAWLAGCAAPSPTQHTPPPAKEPEAEQAIANEPPHEQAPPSPEPSVERSDGRLVVTTRWNAEEILLVRDGIVWTEGGDVRALFTTDESPRVLATLTDPHGLATDGRNVVWLGDETNGRYELASAKVAELPEVAGPGAQEGLAFGDALYARSRPDAMWRIDGVGSTKALSVVRLPFHPDPRWKSLPGFAAAKRVLFVPALARAAKLEYAMLRFATTGKTTAIALQRIADPFTWSVDGDGNVVLISDHRGTIARIRARDREATPLFEHQGATRVCWCGADICLFTGAGEVARRGVSAAEARPIADDAQAATKIACDHDRVAWASTLEPEGSRITVVDLR